MGTIWNTVLCPEFGSGAYLLCAQNFIYPGVDEFFHNVIVKITIFMYALYVIHEHTTLIDCGLNKRMT